MMNMNEMTHRQTVAPVVLGGFDYHVKKAFAQVMKFLRMIKISRPVALGGLRQR